MSIKETMLNTPPTKAIFFDLDGTLVDTAPDFIVTMNELLAYYDQPPIAEPLIRATVSDGARALIQLGFNLTPDDTGFEERRLRLLDIYNDHMGKHCRLFPGMETLLQRINQQQLTWGIITNKPVRFAEPLIDMLSLTHPPELLLCPEHVSKPKPDPEPMELACKTVNCAPNEAFYIGDHIRDIDSGNAAGNTTIAVSYGYIKAQDNINEWGADFIVDDVDSIWPIIEKHREGS